MSQPRVEKIDAECPNCKTLFETRVTQEQLAKLKQVRLAPPYPVPCVIHQESR